MLRWRRPGFGPGGHGARIPEDRPAVPGPLPDHDGHNAGVESRLLDGVRHHFRFDHSCDVVVSPLVEDARWMARFAAVHLRQTGGSHDEAYRGGPVTPADADSRPVADDADRNDTTGIRPAGPP
ncbi:hypothetical protein [Streptomyces spiramenti]|uniref:Uncharacterized protein n=1 Tax=Streptomyces spiramenti TaxID=2720606 RepID=A0ABX1AJ13_9ACTN|nr:hypothetical protein [Streptomyces spiramenti]NJP67134.1 hypothetical protein [Streptomyces spiramenti]